MSNICKEINLLADSKLGGIIGNNVYADVLNKLVNITDKAIEQRYIQDPNQIENIYRLLPDSPDGYNNSINHHNIKEPKERFRVMIQKYGLMFDNMTYENSKDISVKQR